MVYYWTNFAFLTCVLNAFLIIFDLLCYQVTVSIKQTPCNLSLLYYSKIKLSLLNETWWTKLMIPSRFLLLTLSFPFVIITLTSEHSITVTLHTGLLNWRRPVVTDTSPGGRRRLASVQNSTPSSDNSSCIADKSFTLYSLAWTIIYLKTDLLHTATYIQVTSYSFSPQIFVAGVQFVISAFMAESCWML